MTNTSFETLLLSQPHEHIAMVSLNRPQVANAINTRMGHELIEVFTGFSTAAQPPRAIVLTAQGDRHFCAGGDLKDRNGMTDAQFLEQHAVYERMLLTILDCTVPVIAAVNGVAFAGGCELVLACDFVYASDTARFALTETSIGIMPGCGGTQNLPRALGLRRAKELILSATPFSAQEAHDWGMVNRVCPGGSVRQDALVAAQRIAANAPLAVRQAKRSMDYGARMDLRSALFFEVEAYNRLVTTQDRTEGIAAFNEKRPPRFIGQ
ncbi:MAG: enoyl-CoA hydratase-related protein [Burkholderiaceae bacterium]|nr:enoyl-CoA hydratase-related protein [Burkholderiaceae bacterium]